MERLFQKPIEWVIAVQLERYYTKEEIINMYLNKFDFLYNAVGIQSAARVYFGKTPKTLKIEEAATLSECVRIPLILIPGAITSGHADGVTRFWNKCRKPAI